MKFLHTADWHIGKKLNGFDLLEQQNHVFKQLLQIAKEEEVDGIIIAGDLYDRGLPSVDAVETLNQMFIELNLKETFPIFAIAGNHDSGERLGTGSEWYQYSNFYLKTNLLEATKPIELADTQVFLLPYFEPFEARQLFQDEKIKTIQQGVTRLVEEMKKEMKPDKQHLLVTHFFVAGGQKTDSETKVTVGGLDAISLDLLAESFDYVALGHLHSKQALSHSRVKYSGSLLKYSVSEVSDEKGVWIVSLEDKQVTTTFRKVEPLADLQQITASFQKLMSKEYYEQIKRDNYLAISLTDTKVIPNVMTELRKIYPHIIQLDRAYGRDCRENEASQMSQKLQELDPLELFTTYFKQITEDELTEEQVNWLKESLAMTQAARREQV